MRCGIPNAYILDITMCKMHVSLCSYCTVRLLISKSLTGTYEGDKSLNFRQEYNNNIRKISLTKRNIPAEFLKVFNILTPVYIHICCN